MGHTRKFLEGSRSIIDQLDLAEIDKTTELISSITRANGRLFFLGVGGGAGHASHAVNDFRKICKIESYTPSDNVSELTARINDDGWDTSYANWLRESRLNSNDLLFILSVGGGNEEKNVSVNIVNAMKYAIEVGSKITGIVGRDGGFTRKVADACIVIPTVDESMVTPHTEGFQAIVWHLIVSNPILQRAEAKWESLK